MYKYNYIYLMTKISDTRLIQTYVINMENIEDASPFIPTPLGVSN